MLTSLKKYYTLRLRGSSFEKDFKLKFAIYFSAPNSRVVVVLVRADLQEMMIIYQSERRGLYHSVVHFRETRTNSEC